MSAIESVRRSLGDRISALSEAKESELGRLRNQVHTLQAAIPPPQPKKVIVDDTVPAKKPAPKKKPAVPKPPRRQYATGGDHPSAQVTSCWLLSLST